MRGAGVCGAAGTAGRGVLGAAGVEGADAVIEGAEAKGGATTAAGGGGGATTGRAGGAGATAGTTGAAGFSAAGVAIAGRCTGAGGTGAVAGAGGADGAAGAAGFTVVGTAGGFGATGGAAGRGGGGAEAASFFWVIAFNTSPGREICDRSILVLISSSPRIGRAVRAEGLCASAEPRRYARTFSASWSSMELECVFFSVTPTCGSASRMALLLTSSSLARSLIRTLLIRPFWFPALC